MDPTNSSNDQPVEEPQFTQPPEPMQQAQPLQQPVANPQAAFAGATQPVVTNPVAGVPQTGKQSHKVRNGVLWIISGPVFLVCTGIFSVVINFALLGSDVQALILVLNILSWLLGLVGILLIFIGPVVGIIILAKNDQ